MRRIIEKWAVVIVGFLLGGFIGDALYEILLGRILDQSGWVYRIIVIVAGVAGAQLLWSVYQKWRGVRE